MPTLNEEVFVCCVFSSARPTTLYNQKVMVGVLTLRNENFAMKSGVLSGHLGDPYWQDTYDEGRNPGFVWSVRFDPEELDGFPPSFNCEGIHFPVRCWKNLSGQVVNLEAPYDGINGPVAHSVTSEWDQIPYATLQILERAGQSFGIHWEGVCQLWAPEEDSPFLIQTQATFKQIQVHGNERDTLNTFAERLSLYIDVEDFIQHPIQASGQYGSGVQMSYCIFEPKL